MRTSQIVYLNSLHMPGPSALDELAGGFSAWLSGTNAYVYIGVDVTDDEVPPWLFKIAMLIEKEFGVKAGHIDFSMCNEIVDELPLYEKEWARGTSPWVSEEDMKEYGL